MKLHFDLLVICSVIVLGLLDYGDACSSRYTCYKSQKWKTTHYRSCGWWGRRRCTRHVTYFNKMIKTTCHRDCPVNGGWSSWSSRIKSGSCSAACRKSGSSSYPQQQYYQTRFCNNPSPQYGGSSCSGSARQYTYVNCNTHYCTIDGGWTPFGLWLDWSACSKSCDGGSRQRTRKRSCTNPSPKYGGKNCAGSDSDTAVETCNTFTCPIDGGWEPSGLWSDWSDCSKSCDGGSRRRTRERSCTKPSPQYGGQNCVGAVSETAVETCNTFSCPDFCTCDGSGDPHYYTPDGAVIHFMGTCKYTLWNSTIANDPCEFRVETKNERRYGNNNVAYTRFIDFYMKNTKIRILKGGTTLINGIKVSLPSNIGSSSIEISRSGSYVTAVSSECNIRVQFDGNHLVSVKVPRDYFGGNLTGICGNCNGNYHDDLQTEDGKDVSSSGRRGHSDIGNSYKVFDDVEEPDSTCEDAPPIVGIPDDDKENICEYLLSESSPFKACRESNKLNFTKMYESCEYDVAVSTRDDAHCQTLQSTALACSRHGFPVDWRTLNFCPLACNGDFVYKTSVSCTNTCDKPKADQYCLDPPVDGCTCPDDTYLSGDRCVAIDKCGSCNLTFGHVSTNLALGDVFPKGDCRDSQRCDLTSGIFKLVSVPATKTCSADEWCVLNDIGEYNCAMKPVDGGWTHFGLWLDWSACSKSCDGGSRQRTRKRSCTKPSPKYGGKNCAGSDSETAVETCNTFRCPDFCTCDGSGDPHYYTPDGAVIHFMGTCKYTLWNSTIANDPCEFRVETKNERRHGNNNVAWTRFIDFYIKNTKIRILRGGSTLVNGIKVSLPNKDGSSNIEISRSGSYVTAFSSECNIRVQFDGNHLVSVKAERAHFGGKLTGICGNCNGIYSDDLQTKDGKDVSSSGRRGHSDIGNSYKVPDDADDPNSSCDDAPPLMDIPDGDKEKPEKACEYLVSDSSPFKACRETNKLNFTKMYESCEYDVAVSTLDDAHCPTLQSTDLACSRHGFPVHWRNSTFCPLICDGDFVYTRSVSCTNTCDKPKADQYCLDPPVDGCTCPDDTYLSGDRCVAIDKCGSCNLIDGQFSTNLALGDIYPRGNCIKSTTCDNVNGTYTLVTVPATSECSSTENCKPNSSGVYECIQIPASAGGTGSNSTTSPLIGVISKTTAPTYTITTDADRISGSTDLLEWTTTTSSVTTDETTTESDDFEDESEVTSTTPASESTPTTPASEATPTTPASESTPTTPASEVTATTPVSEVTPTTPASEATHTTPASESTPTTPASVVTPTTPVSEATHTTPASESTPTTPASEVTPTTPVSEVTHTSPASEATPTTLASEVTPTTSASEATSEATHTTPASESTPTTPESEVTPTTPASESTPTTPASVVTPTTPVSEATHTTPASESTPTTPASEVTPTTPVSEVTHTSPASEATPTTLASEVTPTTFASEATSEATHTTPASESTPTTPESEVTPTTPASESTPTTPASEATHTTPASSTETVTTTSKTKPTSSPPEVDETVRTTSVTVTTKTTGNPYTGTFDFDCGVYDGRWGYYPDPDNCKGFIQCDWGKPKKRPCAMGTIWSQKVLTCIHGTC